jgi:L-methionine (R)-S-oxide reductase
VTGDEEGSSFDDGFVRSASRAQDDIFGDIMNNQKRLERFKRIADQLRELIAKTDDRAAHCATAAALLYHKIPGVSWTGFYFLKGGDLVIDAYQGPVACLVLERHIGVCWAAIDTNETQVVRDVHAFPGHIACDAQSRSEVVVPVRDRDGRAIGALDVDSRKEAHFDATDGKGYELIVRMLEDRWNKERSIT